MSFSIDSRAVRRARPFFITTLALLVFALAALPSAAQGAGSAYVVNFGSGDVSQYAIGAGGELSALTPPTVAAHPLEPPSPPTARAPTSTTWRPTPYPSTQSTR